MDFSEIKAIEKCGTIAEYWESHGYSKEEAKRIERQQIADMVAEEEYNNLYDQGIWNAY